MRYDYIAETNLGCCLWRLVAGVHHNCNRLQLYKTLLISVQLICKSHLRIPHEGFHPHPVNCERRFWSRRTKTREFILLGVSARFGPNIVSRSAMKRVGRRVALGLFAWTICRDGHGEPFLTSRAPTRSVTTDRWEGRGAGKEGRKTHDSTRKGFL